eukprot:Rhum_TRINITY_DN8387_c0_g1::Rhum_TRINITY_DN8387_c0_g1_i1::g.27560::m.27560
MADYIEAAAACDLDVLDRAPEGLVDCAKLVGTAARREAKSQRQNPCSPFHPPFQAARIVSDTACQTDAAAFHPRDRFPSAAAAAEGGRHAPPAAAAASVDGRRSFDASLASRTAAADGTLRALCAAQEALARCALEQERADFWRDTT